ncbi:MAG: hypothetical protein ACRD35_07770 [Candidatus Acidiferrales bacterium]
MKVTQVAAVAVLVVAASVPSLAKERRVKLDALPPAVKETVLEVSKGLKLRGLTHEVEKGETFYEAELEVDGRTRDVIMDPNGAVVLIEEEVPWSEVPAVVQAAIEKGAEGRRILIVETLTRKGKLEAYEAHMRKGLWGEMEIKVDPAGQPIEEK